MRPLWRAMLACTVMVAMIFLLAPASQAVSLTRHTALLMDDELSVTVKWVSDAPVVTLHVATGGGEKAVAVDGTLSKRTGDGFEGKGSFAVPVDLAGVEQFLPYSVVLEDSQGAMSNKVSGKVRVKPPATRALGAAGESVPSLGMVKVNLPGGNQVSFSSIATDDKGLYEITFRVYDAAGKQVKQQVIRGLGKHWEGRTEPFTLGNGSYRVVVRAVDSSGNGSPEQNTPFDIYDVPRIATPQGKAPTRSLSADQEKVLLRLTPEAYAKLNLDVELPPDDSYLLEVSCGNGCTDLQAQAELVARSLGAVIVSPEEGGGAMRSIEATEQIVVRKGTLSRALEGAVDPSDVLTINITCGGWCKVIKKVSEAVIAVFEAVTRSTGGAGLVPPPVLPLAGIEQSEESRSLNKKLVEGKPYALLVGINNYQHISKLKNAVSDATVMDQVLREDYGFETTVLIDEQATRDNIMKSLNDLRKKLTENDSLIIFYSGHGEFNKETEASYWLPVDAAIDDNTKWLETRGISDQLKLVSAKHVLVIADSCFSGTMTRATNTTLTGTNTREKYLNKLFEKPSRVLIASGGNEPVTDAGGKGHSIFSDVLITALKEPFDKVFTAEELMTRHLKESVGGRTEQTPEYKVIRNSGHDGGDFIFVKKK